jgi:hypothetical protein
VKFSSHNVLLSRDQENQRLPTSGSLFLASLCALSTLLQGLITWFSAMTLRKPFDVCFCVCPLIRRDVRVIKDPIVLKFVLKLRRCANESLKERKGGPIEVNAGLRVVKVTSDERVRHK